MGEEHACADLEAHSLQHRRVQRWLWQGSCQCQQHGSHCSTRPHTEAATYDERWRRLLTIMVTLLNSDRAELGGSGECRRALDRVGHGQRAGAGCCGMGVWAGGCGTCALFGAQCMVCTPPRPAKPCRTAHAAVSHLQYRS